MMHHNFSTTHLSFISVELIPFIIFFFINIQIPRRTRRRKVGSWIYTFSLSLTEPEYLIKKTISKGEYFLIPLLPRRDTAASKNLFLYEKKKKSK